jgi:hypothetical protein
LQIWIEREEALRQRSNFHRDKVVVQFYSLFEKNELTTLWHRVKGRRGNWQERNGRCYIQ